MPDNQEILLLALEFDEDGLKASEKTSAREATVEVNGEGK